MEDVLELNSDDDSNDGDDEESEDDAEWVGMVDNMEVVQSVSEVVKEVEVAMDVDPSPVLDVRMYGLFDCDPHGIEILLCYMFGSKKNAFESPHLAIPTLHWLGVTPSDLNAYSHLFHASSPENLLPMDLKDRKKALSLLKRANVKSAGPVWRQLQRLVWMGVKVEIQAVEVGDLVGVYLGEKVV
ncbi:hypothetical protein HDU98_005798 [Podochytrium sp. JEL0797]|nr:hypothetical protein HDU98_005798 [Podochytrium sp. JEL0797]